MSHFTLEPSDISAEIAKIETECSALTQSLGVLKESLAAIPKENGDDMVLFAKSVDTQRESCEKRTAVMPKLSTLLSDTAQLHQDVIDFHDALPATLQVKLEGPQLLSCYRMFAPFTRATEHVSSYRGPQALSAITLLPKAAMQTHLADVFFQEGKAHNSEALPDIKTLVQLVEHFDHDSVELAVNAIDQSIAHQRLTQTEIAQMFVNKVLVEAKRLHDIEIESLEDALQLTAKSSDMRYSAAGLSHILRENPDNTEAEDETYASLLYLVGQEVVAKGAQLMFGFAVIADDLNLVNGIAAELKEVANPDIAGLTKSVLQAQHQLSWHRGLSAISLSVNNRQNINLDQDITQLRLASQITQNKVGYLSFMSERESMYEAYYGKVVHLINALPEGMRNGKLNEQLNVLLANIKLEHDANTNLFSAIDKMQKAEDTLVIAGNHNKRLSVMHQELKIYAQETQGERAKINLQQYVDFLPKLRANNNEVRHLTEQKHILNERVLNRERYLNDLYPNDLAQQLAELKSPELRAYKEEKNQLKQIINQLLQLDNDYQTDLIKLKKATFDAQSKGGYPDQGDYSSVDAWQTWVIQKFVGNQSLQYRPSIKELILERQLAKNNMSNMAEAYLALLKTVKDSKSSFNPMSTAASLVSPKEIASALGNLHQWSMVHQVEARELTGNLTQTYNIIMANPDTFGSELVNTVKTVWQVGTVQNQVHDILNGTREELPDKANISMTPEMIALLHTAEMAPYVVGGSKGAMNSVTGGPILASVFTMMFPVEDMAAPVVALIGGLLQTGTEQQLANEMRDHRSTEVMVNALIKGMQSDGGLAARGRAVSSYILQRQALLEVGTIARDCFAVGNVGVTKRLISGAFNAWKHATPSAKVFTVLTTVVAGAVLSTSAIAAALLILGSGGLGMITAVGLVICGAVIGVGITKSLCSSLQGSHFLGMGDTARKVKREMSMKRIEQALERLGNNKIVSTEEGVKSLGELLGLHSFQSDQSVLVTRLATELSDIAPDKQAERFSDSMVKYADMKNEVLKELLATQSRELINKANKQVTGLGISTNALEACMAEIDSALA